LPATGALRYQLFRPQYKFVRPPLSRATFRPRNPFPVANPRPAPLFCAWVVRLSVPPFGHGFVPLHRFASFVDSSLYPVLFRAFVQNFFIQTPMTPVSDSSLFSPPPQKHSPQRATRCSVPAITKKTTDSPCVRILFPYFSSPSPFYVHHAAVSAIPRPQTHLDFHDHPSGVLKAAQ